MTAHNENANRQQSTGTFAKLKPVSSLLIAMALASCGGGGSQSPGSNSNNGGGSGNAGNPNGGGGVATPMSRFDLAGGCYYLKADGQFVVRDGSNFVANASNDANAQRFYMQPANLGRYLFYTDDQQLMTGDGSAITATAEPADGSDWTFEGDMGSYNVRSVDQPIRVAGNGLLVQGAPASVLQFEPANGCQPYPEMPTGIAADTFKGPAVGQPVIGFAEIHAHMGMGSEMSDGSRDVGPSAGGVLWGQAVNRFGVTHALGDCSEYHGPDGRLSAENIILDGDPTASHDTEGWPSFIDWPFHDSFLHQQQYWKWLERTWKAGLRMMVVHGTGIEALCNIAQASYGDRNSDCRDMGNGEGQVRYMFDVQDYIDAQYGGPGKGWFRVVTTPTEAREVIAEGKLAVSIGYEFSNIWFCRVTFNPDGSENRECDEDSIDAEIDRAWDLGIRNVFPYHDIDSSLGGTGIFSSILNYVGFSDTGGFWDTYDCPDGGEGETYFYNAGAVLETAPLSTFNDPVTAALTEAGGLAGLPIYGNARQCNARTVTDLGAYAINKMMKKGFVIHIDHGEILSKQYLLDEGAKTTPNYPHPSGHGAQGGLSLDQAEQMIKQGGIIYPALPNGKGWVDFRNRLRSVWTDSGTTRPFAIGYGADANGLRTLPGARGAGSTPVTYPFTLFSGAGWGDSLFDSFSAMQVDMLSIPGGRAWDINQDGMYHYGMIPDIIEEIRIEENAVADDGNDALPVLYRSAEAYLQLWEQTFAAAADARAKNLPVPTNLPVAPN